MREKKQSDMRYYCTALQQYKAYPLKAAYHTVIDGVGRWVGNVPNGVSSQLQIVLTAKRSAEFLAIKLFAL